MIGEWPAEAGPVQRVLELAAPGMPHATRAAEDALRTALEGLATSSWPEVAWRFSLINGDGFPLEFTFSSATRGLRYTSEIEGPETSEARRFRSALRWAGSSELQETVEREAARLQAGRPLQWGAWVGGFHSESRNRRKIYLETGSAAALPGEIALPPAASLMFVGIAAGETAREYYFRKDFLQVAETGRLLRSLSMAELFEPLCAGIAETLPWPIREQLIPGDSGFSLASGAFTVYTYARSVWGGDGFIRRHILELAQKHGWDFQLYEEVTRPLESATGYATRHGILAWIAVPDRPVELRISVRPPG